MPITITATVGASNANSFGTRDESNTYFSGRHVSGYGWSGFSNAQKDICLWLSARVLDKLPFLGRPTNTQQALSWPRCDSSVGAFSMNYLNYAGQLSIADRLIPVNIVPDDIKYAQFELAATILDANGNIDVTGGAENMLPGGVGVEEEQMKSWRIRYFRPEGSVRFEMLNAVSFALLLPYLDESIDLARE